MLRHLKVLANNIVFVAEKQEQQPSVSTLSFQLTFNNSSLEPGTVYQNGPQKQMKCAPNLKELKLLKSEVILIVKREVCELQDRHMTNKEGYRAWNG
jgi:hypothetical protein